MKRLAVLFSLVFATVLMQGCATTASVQGMTSQKAIAHNNALTNKVAVAPVTGGKKTNPLWTSQVSSENFESALKDSLRAAHMLAGDQGQYSLSANLLSLKQPLFGVDMTVTATVQYVVTETLSGKKVFEETLTTPYTATMGDAFVGTKRLQMANEGAIRVSIETLIEKLDQLNLSKVSVR